jgi:hypothetical protein
MFSNRGNMRRTIIAIGFVLGAAPAAAQIVQPVITPPPCTGQNCPRQTRSSMPAAPAHPGLCPPGTVYNPKKGTCKVLPGP